MTMYDAHTCKVSFKTEASAEYDVQRLVDGTICTYKDCVAEEVPIAMVYNGISHAVMLATPKDLEDFALGFSLSEGILDDGSDLYGFEEVTENGGVALHLEIAAHCFVRLKAFRRSMTGRTGCGLCGTESLEKALRLPEVVTDNSNKQMPKLTSAAIQAGLLSMQQQQQLQAATGATHACAWVNLAGEVQVLREDVGRHNALDKLVGAIQSMPQFDKTQGFVMTTSRASVEMVQKTIAAGLQALVAVSAPTGLAIRVANMYGLTLIGFARQDRFVVYTHPKRLFV
jgi:FdhD protein